MESKRLMSIPLLSVVLLLLSVCTAFAMDAADYVTPDSWSKNYTPNGVKSSLNNVKLGDTATLGIGLTTRYQLNIADDSDNDLYQYLRVRLSDVELGEGTVSININGRVSGDLEKTKYEEYDFFFDSMDSERKSADLGYRIYQGNVVFDNVVKHTKLTVGRFYQNYIDSFKIDGAQISAGTENYSIYGFAGVPISFYLDDLETSVYGGGVDLKFPSKTRVRFDAKYFEDSSDINADTALYKLRIDQSIVVGNKVNANVHVGGAILNDAMFYDAGLLTRVSPSQTTFNIWVKGQTQSNDEPVSTFVSDYDLVLGHQHNYVMFGAKVFQGITKYLAVGLSYEGKVNYKQTYGQRDYYRLGGNIDLIRVIPNNYISFTADYWHVDKYANQAKNEQMYFGGRLSQVISEEIELWAGATLTNYRYRFQQIDLGEISKPLYYEDKKLDDNVYVAYIGASWQPLEWLMVQADYMYERSEVIQYEDSKNDSANTVELWLNFLF